MNVKDSRAADNPGDQRETRDEATRWLARLERGLREEEGPALREWLNQRANRDSIVEAARLWHGPEVLGVLSTLFPVSPLSGKRKTRQNILTMSVAAAIAALVVILSTYVLDNGLPWAHVPDSRVRARSVPASRTYSTAIGETREVKLPDGTVITLNTGTRVTVAYWPRSRNAYLPGGEASFRVREDPERPFYVLAGSRLFQTGGGNFNLRVRTPERLELTVTEGSVNALYARTELPDTPALARLRDNMPHGDTTVAAVETAQMEPGLQFVRKIRAREADDLLAWHRGLIIFKAEPLEDAIAEVDRYTTTRFELADDKLRDVRISGDFRTGDIDGLLLALRQDLLIDSRRDRQGHVVLTALTRSQVPERFGDK